MEKHHPQDRPPNNMPEGNPPIQPPIQPQWRKPKKVQRPLRLLALSCLAYLAYYTFRIANNTSRPSTTLNIRQLHEEYIVCSSLKRKPVDPQNLREYNGRWVNKTQPLFIRNAAIWTGEPLARPSKHDGSSEDEWAWISSDIFVDKGLIQRVDTHIDPDSLPSDVQIFDAKGRHVTAGIVDMHSHAGLSSVGNLQDDVNELSNDITPYVRSLDGFDPLQPEIEFIKSGGVTTSLILPGSGNNMGGEAYVLKLASGEKNGRTEISQHDMFADPERTWRYMKMACGENAKRVYGKLGERGPFSRLGESWRFRQALEHATKYVQEQDEWCNKAESIGVENMETHLRQELEWESLGAVLRGQVRVNTHCYTIPDLEAFVRLTNEFKFRVRAFHHAHQTYLVPQVLKRAWGGTPAAALFADNMYYKVEAYRASESAGALLYAHNITTTYVSDNPVLNSQHVVFEAAKAYKNGLPYHAAMASVTSASAGLLGLGHRIGKIKPGFDADIVVWDSDPLSVGATPVQVWVDGAKQFSNAIELKKPIVQPIVPSSQGAQELERKDFEDVVVFSGISRVYHDSFENSIEDNSPGIAIVKNGVLSCVGPCTSELNMLTSNGKTPRTINLQSGYLTSPLTAFGTALGLQEIDAERDTHDGPPPSGRITYALEGLSFGGKQLEAAFRHGVTRAISAPTYGGIDSKGISVGFKTGAKNRLEEDATWNAEVAVHYPFTLAAKNEKTPSISAAVGDMVLKLLDAVDALKENATKPVSTRSMFEEPAYLKRVVQGELPLVLSAYSADTIASIIRFKAWVEQSVEAIHDSTEDKKKKKKKYKGIKLIIIGGAEAHLVAHELAAAKIAVVLAPLLPHAQTWDQRRGLTGPPLTDVATNILLDAGVHLGISVEEMWETRDLGLLAGIAYANSEGRLSEKQALGLVSSNIHDMLGLKKWKSEEREWVVWEGSPLEIGGKVRGIGGNGKTSVWV